MTSMRSGELSPADQELVEAARLTVEENSDGATYTMGAAVRAADGRIFTGINVYHFTGGPCAELVALGAARAAGARDLTAIVAVGDGGRGPQAPCGRDRQVLADLHPDISVILPTPQGVRRVPVRELLPLPYVAPDD